MVVYNPSAISCMYSAGVVDGLMFFFFCFCDSLADFEIQTQISKSSLFLSGCWFSFQFSEFSCSILSISATPRRVRQQKKGRPVSKIRTPPPPSSIWWGAACSRHVPHEGWPSTFVLPPTAGLKKAESLRRVNHSSSERQSELIYGDWIWQECVCVCVFKWQSNAFNQGARQREREEVMEY